jgi:hypothetical protein
MAAQRTPEELRAAIASMFRIRAVESPANEKGIRKVWHRGTKDAELVSELDLDGHVARHEFTLFGDVVIWERGRGLSTGVASSVARAGDKLELDLGLDDNRLKRVADALRPYSGDDRIIAHLKMLLTAGIGNPLEGRGRVTSNVSALAAPPIEPPEAPKSSRAPYVIGVIVGLALMAIVAAIVLR